MTTPTRDTPGPGSALELDDRSPTRRRIALGITLTVVAALAIAWVYVLFFYDPGLMIDELADRQFPEAAEQVCAASVAELEQLPPANLAGSADERAATVAESNVILAAMIADLRPLAPTEPANVADGVNEWLDDWDTYIEDRTEYVENLRSDDDARFLETTKGSDTKGITRAINAFAEVNKMDSCTTPADLS